MKNDLSFSCTIEDAERIKGATISKKWIISNGGSKKKRVV